MMASSMVAVATVAMLWCSGVVTTSAASMEEKCAADFTKLAVCLSYATGKATVPTKDCCVAVEEIKESEPECLCFIMQQAHSGSQRAKSLGIQESKLLQLPSTCSLKNASLTDCPKLLGLAPNSKDAAIFTSNSTTAPAAATTTPATSATQSGKDSSGGTHLIAVPLGSAVAAIVLFLFTIPIDSITV